MATEQEKRQAEAFLQRHRRKLDMIAEQGSSADWLLAACLVALSDLVLPTTPDAHQQPGPK